MNIICVGSPKGGVGKTTLAANLAYAIQRLGHKVIAIDFDNQNSLRLHFGMALADSAGHATELGDHVDWSRLVQESDSGVRYLPYGRVSRSQIISYDQLLHTDPTALVKRLASFAQHAEVVFVADLPPGPSAALQALSGLNPIMINVLLPDGASLSLLPEIESGKFYNEESEQRNYFVLNQVDVRSQLNRDVTQFLNERLGSSLLGMVHRDEAVSEASASQMSVFKYAQASSVTADIDLIARNVQRMLPKMQVSEYKKFSR